MCKECDRKITAYETAVRCFEERHPKYCRRCGGAGVKTESYDPSPAGVSLSPGSMTEDVACPECAEKNLCSLCGKKLTNGGKRRCGCKPESKPLLADYRLAKITLGGV